MLSRLLLLMLLLLLLLRLLWMVMMMMHVRRRVIMNVLSLSMVNLVIDRKRHTVATRAIDTDGSRVTGAIR